MLKIVAATVSSVLLSSAAAFAYDCAPHCDYVHDYGPYDFSYVYPGLFGFPICNREGNCLPHLIYSYSGLRPHIVITVRPTRGAKPIVRRSKNNN